MVSPHKDSYKNNRLVCRPGGYFCDLLLPIEYPRPNAVSTRLITAIRPSIVIMAIIPLSYKFPM